MPKRITGVSARLMDCAKAEFLEKGFQNASIRDIAKKAETSARAIYTRFPDKAGLFASIVEPYANELISFFSEFSNNYWHSTPNTEDAYQSLVASTDVYIKMIDYAYDHLDEFLLILTCSEGTCYSDFIEQLTIVNCKNIEEYGSYSEKKIIYDETTMKLLHMLTHSFYSGLFEPILHKMCREEAHYFVKKLCGFFINGIQVLI